MSQHTERFAKRVESYIRTRPGYPPEILDTLRQDFGFKPSWTAADVGSGTGILSELFLKNGNAVLGVEPNTEMREASERLLCGYPAFRAVAGSAEETTLPPGSVDLISAGQAFHWFDRDRARREFERVLRPGGVIAVVWNTRKVDGSPFGQAYEDIIRRYSSDYGALRHENLGDETNAAFFGPLGCLKRTFDNSQRFDLDGIKGRMASMSWAPLEGDPRHAPMLLDLERAFHAHQRGAVVLFEYVTELYCGRLSA